MELRTTVPEDIDDMECFNCSYFLGEYYFFKKVCDEKGYKIKNLIPDLTNRLKKIVFPEKRESSFKAKIS